MAITYDGSFAYSAEQANELVLRPIVDAPDIRDIFGVKEGVKGKMGVHYLERVENITHKDPGCGLGAEVLPLTTTYKEWAPVDMKIWLKQCWKDFRGKALEWKLKTLNDKADLTNTEIADYLIDIAEHSGHADLVRLLWFSDPDITAGNLTGGSGDVGNFNAFLGAWPTIFDGVTAGSIYRRTVDSGSGDLEAGESVDILLDLFENMSPELAGQPQTDLQLLVSRTVFNNYRRYLLKEKMPAAYEMLQSGKTTLTFDGVPLTVVNEWGKILNARFRPGGAAVANPHRAILTAYGNLQAGFDAQPINAPTDNPFRVFYDEMSETWNLKLLYAADFQLADHKLINVAY